MPADLGDSGGPECRDFTNRTTMINTTTTTTTTSWPLQPRYPLSSREPRLWSGRPMNNSARSSSSVYFVGVTTPARHVDRLDRSATIVAMGRITVDGRRWISRTLSGKSQHVTRTDKDLGGGVPRPWYWVCRSLGPLLYIAPFPPFLLSLLSSLL